MAPVEQMEQDVMNALAAARLERQNKRILETEASIPVITSSRAGKGSFGKSSRIWKHLDLIADLSDNTLRVDATATSNSDVRSNTSRGESRASSRSRSSVRTSVFYAPGVVRSESSDTTEDFQLITGRRTKTGSSKNVGGLNAYEDKPEAKQSTVEASYSKREICNVFGNELPGPDFMDHNPGYKHGQLQFIQHPNGDVSAHQWSTDSFIWQNIGQYSNIRKKIEGQLGADRLKGETAFQTLQQNTLAYFRTIAKQREAMVMGVPFGPKEIQASMPNVSRGDDSQKPKAIPEADRPSDPFNDTTPYEPAAAVTDERQPETMPLSRAPAINEPSPGEQIHAIFAPTEILENSRFRNAEKDYFSSRVPQLSSQQHYNPLTSELQSENQTGGRMDFDFEFPPSRDLTDHQFGPTSHTTPSVFQVDSFTGAGSSRFGSAFRSQQQDPSVTSTAPKPAERGDPFQAYQDAFPELAARITSTTATPTKDRSSIKEYLHRLGDAATARNVDTASARTVLHDPFQNEPTMRADDPPKSSLLDPRPSDFHAAVASIFPSSSRYFQSSSRYFPAVSRTPALLSGLGENLLDSSPDREWERKPCESFEIRTPGLNLRPEPTLQTLKGPFFTGDPCHNGGVPDSNDKEKKDPEQELRDWFHSGNKFARQEEFYERIKGPSTTLGPISPPSASRRQWQTVATGALPSNRKQNARDTTRMTRLLVPVFENLASYVEGRVEKRRDYFCRSWTTPPDWAIDMSPNGNNSFFDKDWGQPPPRLGRDPRYRPFAGEGRFGGLAAGFDPFMGSGLDSRFRYGRYA